MATCATHRLEQIWPGLSCLQQAQKVQGILRDRAGLAVDLSMWLRDRRAANTALPNLWLHLKAWLLEMPTVGLQFMFHARIYGGRASDQVQSMGTHSQLFGGHPGALASQ